MLSFGSNRHDHTTQFPRCRRRLVGRSRTGRESLALRRSTAGRRMGLAGLRSALPHAGAAGGEPRAPRWRGCHRGQPAHARDGCRQVAAVQAAAPGRLRGLGAATSPSPAAMDALAQAVKAGAKGFGEMKLHYATDGPEFKRAYALAADLGVPILIHFQEVDHTRERRKVESGIRDPVRGHAEGVSEDDVHRPCRRVLGQRQRRLSQRERVSGRADRARRDHGSAAR